MTKARIKYEELALRIADAAGDMDEELEPSVSELVKRLEEQPDDYFCQRLTTCRGGSL